MTASVNGVALHAAEEPVAADELRERAWAELLRQEAVRLGRLPAAPAQDVPAIDEAAQRAIHAMLDSEVPLRVPSGPECERYHAANQRRFVQGRRAHVRHILFAVSGRVDVQVLAARAERVLLELARADAPPQRFAELARELSNCPSGAHGGDLGWLVPQDCAPEIGAELFDSQEFRGTGLLPRLVRSRFGLHVVDVLAREEGRAIPFEDVRERIAVELAERSRATALHQYMRVLAGRARIEGVALEAASSPLVQ